MSIVRNMFSARFGTESDSVGKHDVMVQTGVGRNCRAQVAPPTAYPFPEDIISQLARLLLQHDSVAAAYLVQITYLNPDMSSLAGPCLSLCVEYDGLVDKARHDQISTAARDAVGGKLGRWRSIRIIAAASHTLRAANATTAPFYTRPGSRPYHVRHEEWRFRVQAAACFILPVTYFIFAVWFMNSVDIFGAHALRHAAYEQRTGDLNTRVDLGCRLLWLAQWYVACLPACYLFHRYWQGSTPPYRTADVLYANLALSFIFLVIGVLLLLVGCLLSWLTDLVGIQGFSTFFDRYIDLGQAWPTHAQPK